MKRILLFSLTFLLLLGGCAKQENTIPAQTEFQGAEETAADWKTQGFQALDMAEREPELWVSEFTRLSWEPELGESETLGRSLGAAQEAGGRLYRFFEIDGKDKDGQPDKRWMLECCDAQTGEVSLTPISREDLGIGGGPWQSQERTRQLADAAVIAPGSYVFLYAEDEKTQEGYHINTLDFIYTDLQGSSRRVSMFDTYLENGILEKLYQRNGEYMTEPVSGVYIPSLFCCDGQGNTYSMSGSAKYGYEKLWVFDPEGALLFLYQSGDQSALNDSFRTQSGDRIIVLYDHGEQKYEFFWPDMEEKKLRKAGGISSRGDALAGFYGLWGNTLYYKTEKNVIRWDIESGERTQALSFAENGLRAYSTMQLLVRGGAQPAFWMETDNGRQYLAKLSREKNRELPTVRISNIYADPLLGRRSYVRGSLEDISRLASYATEVQPGVIYSYESKGDTAAFRDRVLAELAAGEGPDILFVSREDLIMLQEKGVLADLTELVPEGFWERVYPAVKELGTVNGQTAGVTAWIEAFGIAVAKDVWPGDTWTFEDMLRLMEEKRLQPLLGYPYRYMEMMAGTYYYTSRGTRVELLEYQLENPAFIDREAGECHAEDGWFQSFLKLTDVEGGSLENDGQTLLNGGKTMYQIHLNGPQAIALFDVQISGENGHYPGYPANGGCGNYILDDGFIAVNKNSPYLEYVNTYLECMLSDWLLKSTNVPIIRADPEDITTDEEGKLWWKDEQLTVFEDGSTSLERAEEFLGRCVPAPRMDPKLLVILEEELDALEEGGRTIEQAADILGRRIQLYLNETK